MKNEIIALFEKSFPVIKKSIEMGNDFYNDEEKSNISKLFSYYNSISNLIIVRLDAIGDCLLFTNSLKQLRLLFPNAKITYLCYKETKEIIDRCDYIDIPIYIERNQLAINKAYREQIYALLQGYQFDLLINPLFSREFLAEEIVYFINAKVKIGLSGDESNINPLLLKVTNNWYDYILQTETKHNKFELHRNAEIVNLLGGKSDKMLLPELWTNKGDADFINNILVQYKIDNFAIVFPGTKGGKSSVKFWGSENYANLIDYIHKNSNLKVIILGGVDEEEICNEIVSLCQTQPIVFQGQFPIWKSVEIVKRSKFYVGSDTSIAHFSSALKVPTLVLLGGGHFGRFFPYPDHDHVKAIFHKMNCYNCNWKCTQSTNKCIKDITVNDVKKILNELSLLVMPKEKSISSSKYQFNFVTNLGSKPKIDLLLPPSNNHSWHLKDAWVINLEAAGLLNKAFYFSSDKYQHFFDYLKKGAGSDMIFALGGDHHLSFLHDTPQKIELWTKYRKPKACYSYESSIESQYSFYITRAENASKVFSHFLVADENDVSFFTQKNKNAIWFPQFVDEKFFRNNIPFNDRKTKLFFKGKLWSEYKQRQKIVEALAKIKLVDLVDGFLTNSELVENYNSYKAAINPPGVFGGFNVRTFESLACGNLLFQFLPPNRPLNNSLFQHGKHLIYFDSNNTDLLIDQIHEFQSNSDDYKNIAEAGYNEVLENHTIFKRMEVLLEWVLNKKAPSYPKFENVNEKELKKKIVNNICVHKKINTRIKVTAIVSVYNSELFIEGCLNNLIEQTLYKKNELEIILVNTGSEQNEDNIINKYLSNFNNIKYIKIDERETIYSAWNRGIKEARGKYITNANSDDRHKKNALEIMCTYLEDNSEIDVIYADQYQTNIPNDYWGSKSEKNEQIWSNFDQDLILFGCFIGPQPMWKKSLHNKFGYFQDGLQVVGDFEFWLRISHEAHFLHLFQILGLYYYSEDSAEHRNKTLTENEHREVQRYYLAKYVKTENDIKRIMGKLKLYDHNPVMKSYINNSRKLLSEREKGISFELEITNFISTVKSIEDREVFNKINEFVGTIEDDNYIVDKEQFLELLYLLKASYFIKENDLENARKSYEKVLEINSSSSYACSGLAELLFIDENYEAAKTMFEWAVKNDPNNNNAVSFLGKVNLLLGIEENHNSLLIED